MFKVKGENKIIKYKMSSFSNSKLPYVARINCPCAGTAAMEKTKMKNYRLRGEISQFSTTPDILPELHGPRILHFARIRDLNICTYRGGSINELYALRYRFPDLYLCSTNVFFPHRHFKFGLVRYGNQLLYCTHPREDPFICTQLSLRDNTKYVRVNFVAEQPVLDFPLFPDALVQDQFCEINFDENTYANLTDLPTDKTYNIEDIYKYIKRFRKSFLMVKSIGYNGKEPLPPQIQHDCFKAKLFFINDSDSLPRAAYYYGSDKMTKGPLPLCLAVKQSVRLQLAPDNVEICVVIKRHVFLFNGYLALSIFPVSFVGNVVHLDSSRLWTDGFRYKLIDERDPPKGIKKFKNKTGHMFFVWNGLLVLPTSQSLAVPKELFLLFNNIRCKFSLLTE